MTDRTPFEAARAALALADAEALDAFERETARAGQLPPWRVTVEHLCRVAQRDLEFAQARFMRSCGQGSTIVDFDGAATYVRQAWETYKTARHVARRAGAWEMDREMDARADWCNSVLSEHRDHRPQLVRELVAQIERRREAAEARRPGDGSLTDREVTFTTRLSGVGSVSTSVMTNRAIPPGVAFVTARPNGFATVGFDASDLPEGEVRAEVGRALRALGHNGLAEALEGSPLERAGPDIYGDIIAPGAFGPPGKPLSLLWREPSEEDIDE